MLPYIVIEYIQDEIYIWSLAIFYEINLTLHQLLGF